MGPAWWELEQTPELGGATKALPQGTAGTEGGKGVLTQTWASISSLQFSMLSDIFVIEKNT